MSEKPYDGIERFLFLKLTSVIHSEHDARTNFERTNNT